MPRPTRRKPRAPLTDQQREVLRLVAEQEPRALIMDDPSLLRATNALIELRLLGKVDVHGTTAYRLTEFGRTAVAVEGVLRKPAPAQQGLIDIGELDSRPSGEPSRQDHPDRTRVWPARAS